MAVLGENIHFHKICYFVISDFDMEGVNSIYVQKMALYHCQCIKYLHS